MTVRRGNETNLYLSDSSVGLFTRRANRTGEEVHGRIDLGKGILENGYVADAEQLVLRLKTLFKANGLKPKRIRLVLNSRNVVMRVVDLPRGEVAETGIAAKLDAELGKTIHFPFPHPRVSYNLIGQDDASVKVFVVASDDKLLNDYLDVFDRLNVREVVFDTPALCLYTLFTNTANVRYRSMMLVTVYDRYFTIRIFEEDIPVFNLVEEFEGDVGTRYEEIDNYVERVANYYRYNMNRGDRSIESALVVNLGEQDDEARFESAFSARPFGIPYRVFKFPDAPSGTGWNRAGLIAFAAGLEKTGNLAKIPHFDFRLDRPLRQTRMMQRILAVAFAVFSIVSLVYIPYHTTSEEIFILENENRNLSAQLEALEAEIALLPSFSAKERAYSDAYDALVDAGSPIAPYLADLFDMTGTDVEVLSWTYGAADREIRIVLEGSSLAVLQEYVLAVYEAHGIVGEPESGRWIDTYPVYAGSGTNRIEVTFRHA